MSRKEQWDAKISIQGDKINAWVENEEEKADAWYFYLYDIDNILIEKSKQVKKAKYCFKVPTGGIYRVKIFRKKDGVTTNKMTKYVDCYSEKMREEFRDFCESNMEYTLTSHLKPDNLFKMTEPYKDFAVILDGKNDTFSRSFLDRYGLNIHTTVIEYKKVKIISKDILTFCSKGILFSGLARCGHAFVCGERDVTDPTQIDDQTIGNFTYVKRLEKGLEIGNDYFGTAKIFYYMAQDISVISNNYHLLLLILKEAGVRLEANKKMILALLCKSRQVFQQSITREREMLGVYMLPADQNIEIKKEILIKNKQISTIFQMPKIEDIRTCEYLLEEGKKEIIENTRMILSDDRYETVIADLTGGLDSRLVYGAMSNLDAYRHKIVLHSDGSEAAADEQGTDLSIALKVNCINNYDYNNVRTTYIWRVIEKAENEMISLDTLNGYYYPHSAKKMIFTGKSSTSVFELNGFYGEICCRPYYARTLLQNGKKYKDIQTFVSVVANRNGILSGSSYEALKEKLCEELKRLPGNSYEEKWEIQYLFYRNGLHCNKIWEYSKSTPQWGPLQSKALFMYKHLTFGKIKGIREQLQLIYSMDPQLLQIPFERLRDEEERKEFLKSVNMEEIVDGDHAQSYEQVKARWKQRLNERRNQAVNTGEEGKDFHELWKKAGLFDQQLKERIFEIFHKLMRYREGVFQELFGIAVFSAIKENRFEVYDMHVLYKKLAAVCVQIQIFE